MRNFTSLHWLAHTQWKYWSLIWIGKFGGYITFELNWSKVPKVSVRCQFPGDKFEWTQIRFHILQWFLPSFFFSDLNPVLNFVQSLPVYWLAKQMTGSSVDYQHEHNVKSVTLMMAITKWADQLVLGLLIGIFNNGAVRLSTFAFNEWHLLQMIWKIGWLWRVGRLQL